jgi:AraC-like DNA-binding protein
LINKRRENKNVNYYDDFTDEVPYFKNSNKPIEIISNNYFTESIYHFNPHIGIGSYRKITCDDFRIDIIDLQLSKDLIIKTKGQETFLEFSLLIEGEQLIMLLEAQKTFVYESNQCLLTLISDVVVEYVFSKNAYFKEVRIRISKKMIDYFKINTTSLELEKINNHFIKKIPEKCKTVLVDLISNKYNNQNKHIYMIGKIAELLTYYLDSNPEKKPYCAIVNNVNNVKKYIHNNIDKQITAKKISQELKINQIELKKYFIKTIGISIKIYTLKTKMEKAKQFLRYTKKPIYEIAEEVGYKNATHFSNAFKRYTNVSPKKYRINLSLK